MREVYTVDERRYEKMEYNRFGNSGPKFPAVSLGSWHNFCVDCDYENMRAMYRTAFDLGITQFDLANNYGPSYVCPEENLGKILRENFGSSMNSRHGEECCERRLGPYGNQGPRNYPAAGIEQSLKLQHFCFCGQIKGEKIRAQLPSPFRSARLRDRGCTCRPPSAIFLIR